MKFLAKLARLTDRSREKSSIRTKRANRIVQWVMWSPKNALIAGVSAGAVFMLGIVFVLTQFVYDYQVAEFEHTQQAAATPTTSGVGDYGQYGLTGITPTPAPTSTAKATSAAPTTSTGTPAPSATVVTEKAPAGAEEQAQAKTKAFIQAWLAGPTAASQQAWLAGLAPHTSPELLDLFKLTDRAKIPTGTSIESMTSVTVPGTGTAHVSATMKGRGVLGVVLEADQTGAWTVVDVAPEDQG